MAETDCLMQPFSYMSSNINDSEGNPLHALGESISFGRFASESLAWERWSSFSHNRYVEEAKKFSQPGSVAQKKAFFEAHYKSIAARKAAALLEQANANGNASASALPTDEPQSETTHYDVSEIPIPSGDLTMGAEGQHFNIAEAELKACDLKEAESASKSQNTSENSTNCESPTKLRSSEIMKESDVVSECQVTSLPTKYGEAQSHARVTEPKPGDAPTSKKRILKVRAKGQHFCIAEAELKAGDLKEAESASKSQNTSENLTKCESPTKLQSSEIMKESDVVSECQVTSLPTKHGEAQSHACVTEPKPGDTPTSKKRILKRCSWNHKGSSPFTSRGKPTAFLKSSVQGTTSFPCSPARPTVFTQLKKEHHATPGFSSRSEASTSMRTLKQAVPTSKPSIHGKTEFSSSPAKSMAAVHPRKEVNATPVCVKSTLDSWEKKRATPKSLHTPVNRTPPASQAIARSRVAGDGSETSTYSSTLPRTPTPVFIKVTGKYPLATTQSETRRTKTPLRSLARGCKTTDPKCCSNASTPSGNRWESSILSSPFNLRTEERAIKRKEKLEATLGAQEAPRVLQQQKFMEKAERELRKLSPSLCFKARPLPDFYKERRTPKQTEDQTKKLGGKPSPSSGQGSASRHPRKPLISELTLGHPQKPLISELTLGKNGRPWPTISARPSLTNMVMTENTPPNIQL